MTASVQEQAQTDADEMASALAGYNARGDLPPAEEPETSTPDVAVEETDIPDAEDVPAEPTVAEKLEALKAEVKAMKESGDPEAVRRLHGEIGNINRTIKQLQASPKTEAAPATDEVAEALASAETFATEYPEIGAPVVRALKAIAAKTAQTTAPELPDIDSVVSQKVLALRQQDAIEALTEEHPDFETVRETPEFKAWLSGKSPEYQERLNTTWNPAVVSRGITEFKDSLKDKQKKQNRLVAAVTPQGVPKAPGPSTIPDEQGFLNGYRRKRL